MSPDDPRHWLVAHRGHARAAPENTLAAIRSALECGLTHVEVDVQITSDGVPVLLHDGDLRRTAGADVMVRDLHSGDLPAYRASEAERFGGRFQDEPLPRLEEAVGLFEAWPGAVPVIEVKWQSALSVGVDRAVAIVLEHLVPVLERSILISFVERAVLRARRLGVPRVGWCVNRYDADSELLARAMAPDFLLVDHRQLPAVGSPLWSGPWRWMSWEVADPRLALSLRERGVDYVETMACAEMLAALEPRSG